MKIRTRIDEGSTGQIVCNNNTVYFTLINVKVTREREIGKANDTTLSWKCLDTGMTVDMGLGQ